MRTFLGSVTALVVGGAVAALLGCLQMLLLHEFRGIVAAILTAVSLGIAVGWATGCSARLWHLRDSRIVVALGLASAIVAELTTFWVLAHLLQFGEEARTVPLLVPLGELGPREAIAVLGRALDEGAWHWTRHYHVRGIALTLVWIVEAITILGLSSVFAVLAVRARPYCEICRTWLRGPTRVGPLELAMDPAEERDSEELDLNDTLRNMEPAPAEERPPYLVDLWHCRCPDRAVASIRCKRPGSKLETLIERQPITREVHNLLQMRDRDPLIAAEPPSPIWASRSGPPDARTPDQSSRWVRPCSSCSRDLATGFWEHLNGFAVTCPHCDETHSHPGEIALLLALTAFFGPLAFFLSMRPLRALPVCFSVVLLVFAGHRWFAGHPSLALEVVFYLAVLIGCVVINIFAYKGQHAGRV